MANSEPLEKTIQNQLATLESLFAPQPSMDAFLEEKLLPLDEAILKHAARDVAEMLILSPSNETARKELSEDRSKTQAFFSIAKVSFPYLQKELFDTPRFSNPGFLPFYEVAFWILLMSEIE